MKVLAIDPGAERCGWCVLEGDPERKGNKPPEWVGSGIFGLKRGGNKRTPEPFQQYRLRLVDFWIKTTPHLLDCYHPDVVVSEIVPAVGGGNFRAATQSQLAETAATVLITLVRLNAIPVEQIGATSVKARIGGSKKATKVGVRNGVFRFMPETKDKFEKAWKVVHDESDAFGVALTYFGFDGRKQ